jgi:hypothetical protein
MITLKEEPTMKTATILATLILALALYGCNGGQEEELKNKISIVESELAQANLKIGELEAEISSLKRTQPAGLRRTPRRQTARVKSTVAQATPTAE